MPRFSLTILLGCLLLPVSVATAEPNLNTPGSALMAGFPPPAEQRVTTENMMEAPFNRWALQNLRELQPTRNVDRGIGITGQLIEEPVPLAGVNATVREGEVLGLEQFLLDSGTDAIVVLSRGKLVYERYFNGMSSRSLHLLFSVSKSFIGTLALLEIEAGRLDPQMPVQHYLPELAGSAFADATVQQVLNMRVAVKYREGSDDKETEKYRKIFGIGDRSDGDDASND